MPAQSQKPAPSRLTVQLLPDVSEQLHAICDRKGYSKTDAVNRALMLYNWAYGIVSDSDRELIIRDPETGESTQIVFT